MPTGDAVAREAAWLAASGDGLPALLAASGGPWQVVQAYWPGARLATQQTGVYVQRAELLDPRVSNQRLRPGHDFLLKLVWPVRATNLIAETEAQNLDNAVELLRQRIAGPPGDKTHGGRFLSAAETPGRPSVVRVRFEDPEITIPQQKALRAVCTYSADDFEISD